MDPLLISVVINLALMVALILSEWEKRENRRRLKDLHQYLDNLERAFRDDGGQTCCLCGKPYQALNDPDYSPELNICRDCMWKMYYENCFGDEEHTLRESLGSYRTYRRETYG